jgi:alcohol dehydrogenase class IV
MRFEFATAARIIFGPGTLAEIGPIAVGMLGNVRKSKVLLVTGVSTKQPSRVVAILAKYDIEYITLPVTGEPTVEMVRSAVDRVLTAGCRLIISIGGGSAIDAGKAVAALATNGGNPVDYMEVVGQAKPLTQPPLPFIAIPTTAGTGAEVTRNAVLASPAHHVKVSLRSPTLLPRLAVIDPELTYELPPELTASTGLDALTQLIEAFVSRKANPMTDALCREGMRRAGRSLRIAFEQGDSAPAREDMSLASLLSGLALANSGLGAAHGFAAPVGGMFTAPHGAVCAALLPHVMAVNVRALGQRDPESEALRRYDEVARVLTGNPGATAPDGINWVSELRQALRIPSIGSYGVKPEDVQAVVENAAKASSMQGNPILLTHEELTEILTAAL